MKTLELIEVDVSRGKAPVLHGVSLRVEPGEVVTLLGSNAVGKSTTLRTISGLHRATAGTIRYGDADLAGMRPELIVRQGIAHVPEGRQVFAGLTVHENLVLGAKIKGRLSDEQLQRVLHLFPDLEVLLERKAGVLSGGQQQMLAIARGLVSEPSILLLDEPSLGLAPKIVATIGRAIRDLGSDGLSVLLVEQNATMALDLASRGYLMAGGRIVIEGTVDELRESEAVRETYLGASNE